MFLFKMFLWGYQLGTPSENEEKRIKQDDGTELHVLKDGTEIIKHEDGTVTLKRADYCDDDGLWTLAIGMSWVTSFTWVLLMIHSLLQLDGIMRKLDKIVEK